MPSVRCQCGAVYNFKPEHAGRQARCKRCDAIVIAQPMPASLLKSPPPPATPDAAARRPAAHAQAGALSPQSLREGDGFIAFVADALWSFAFIARPINLIAWLSVAFLLLLSDLPLPGVFGLAWGVGITAMVYGYYMQAAQGSAGGDDILPIFEDWENWVQSALLPTLRFAATAVVFLPALLFEGAVAFEAVELAQSERETISMALLALGLYLWPACLLGVAILGAGFIVRWDLIVRTALAAPLKYLMVCAAALLAGALATAGEQALQPDWLEAALTAVGAQGENALLTGLARAVALAFLSTYVMLVTMRVVGLYYRRCRHRLPFDAG